MHIVDLKRIELPQFADAPQVAGFYNRAHEVPGILDKLHAEMERRLDLFEGVCNNLAGWNRQNPHNRLPRLLFVVDELAILTRSDYKKEAIKRIAELASLGRGVGIHLLMATQTVTKEVLTIDILANIEGRICYSVRNTTASTLAIGNGAAVGLSPPGRCVFVDGLYDHYLQTPYASQEDIIEVLEKAGADPEEEETPPEPLDFLATIALTNYGGRASYRDLYNDYANQAAPWKIGEKRVRDTLSAAEYNPKESDNATTVEHDGKTYILTPGNIVSGAQSRWFIPVNGHLPDGDELEDQLRRVMQQRLDPEKAAPS
jgi:DNA segregation ATPase FtsK/SpoIIIE-like protein